MLLVLCDLLKKLLGYDCIPSPRFNGIEMRIANEDVHRSRLDGTPWDTQDRTRTLHFYSLGKDKTSADWIRDNRHLPDFKTLDVSPKNCYSVANFLINPDADSLVSPGSLDIVPDEVVFSAGSFGLGFATSGGPLWGGWDIPRVLDAFQRLNHRFSLDSVTDVAGFHVLYTDFHEVELATQMEVSVTVESRFSRV